MECRLCLVYMLLFTLDQVSPHALDSGNSRSIPKYPGIYERPASCQKQLQISLEEPMKIIKSSQIMNGSQDVVSCSIQVRAEPPVDHEKYHISYRFSRIKLAFRTKVKIEDGLRLFNVDNDNDPIVYSENLLSVSRDSNVTISILLSGHMDHSIFEIGFTAFRGEETNVIQVLWPTFCRAKRILSVWMVRLQIYFSMY